MAILDYDLKFDKIGKQYLAVTPCPYSKKNVFGNAICIGGHVCMDCINFVAKDSNKLTVKCKGK